MNNGDTSAFPIFDSNGECLTFDCDGMTKREYFAAMAMQGLLANSFQDGINEPLSHANNTQIAGMAVDQADCLLQALEEQ